MANKFNDNIDKWIVFCSWCRYYPDLFLDLIKPPYGGITLDLDQRVYLRSIVRFFSVYGVFPRGYGKTYVEVLGMILCCIFFPNMDISMTAQTKENAIKMLEDKFTEIMRHFPLLKGEISKSLFSKNDCEILFTNGSRITPLANSQNSKGLRRRRMNIEESALLNNELFEDALEPIVEVPRYTVGKLGIADPCELNGQINFFTTAGFRGTDEFDRSVRMVNEMVNLQGKMVLGGDFFIASWYGRGSSKSKMLQRKKDMSYIAFAQNYQSRWVGCADNALVNINKLMACRNLTKHLLSYENIEDEIYLGVDVARSQKATNNQSSVSVVRVKRDSNNKILEYQTVNIIKIPNILNFTAQAVKIKKIRKQYNAKVVVVDGNGLGAGLIDELLKDTIDPDTGESLGCWDTINTDNTPEVIGAEKIVYDLKAQTNQNKVIINFVDLVASGKLRLLENRQISDYIDGNFEVTNSYK